MQTRHKTSSFRRPPPCAAKHFACFAATLFIATATCLQAGAQAPSTSTPVWLNPLMAQALHLAAQSREIGAWTANATNTFSAVLAYSSDGHAAFALTNGETRFLPLDSLSPQCLQAAAALDDTPAPRANPPWLKGYRIRYTLRAMGNILTNNPKTILAQLPTGGWLKPDASDLIVQTLSGRTLNPVVLSHDSRGQTLIQFNRNAFDRWYWIYAMNPNATPETEPALAAKIMEARKCAEAATLVKMTAQKAAAEKASALREAADRAARDKATSANAAAEIAEWDRLLPELEKSALEAEARVAPANAAAEALASVAAAAKPGAEQAAELLRKAAAETAEAKKNAAEKAAEAKKTADEAVAAKKNAEQATPENKPAAETAALEKTRLANAAAAAKTEADRSVLKAEQAEKAAELASQAPRMAFQKADTEKAAAETSAKELAAAAKNAGNTLAKGRNARAAATALKTKADSSYQSQTNSLPGLKAALEQASAASGRAVEAARAADEALFAIAVEADPSLHREGLSVEFRDWAGDELSDWPTVFAGLRRSDTVIGNGVIREILQYANPFRRDNPRNFAASFRGHLRIDTPGVYRFFVNSDDAAFLFINNFIVYSRRGANMPLRGRVPIYSIGVDMELEAGVHPIEVHQVVGRSPGATGRCTFLWMPPGANQWALVPSTAFTSAMAATPTAIEEAKGAQAAAFVWGMDDCLSSDGVTLYLARFQALGAIPNPERLRWNFGDGTTATGAAVWHVFMKQGDFEVSLDSGGGLPVFRRRITPWTPTAPTSPLSPLRAIQAISSMDIAKMDVQRLTAVFEFLLICPCPERRPLLERVCVRLLAEKNQDVKLRQLLHIALMDAIANQGRADEAIAKLAPALEEFQRIPSLRMAIQLKAADIHRLIRRDPDRAAAIYNTIIESNRRSAHPAVRQAATSLGDLFLDNEDIPRATEALRLAASLGAAGFGRAQDAATRGALLRAAEQQLKDGNIRQTRRMLERLENEFPEQKTEGLYRFLRGETDRASGRYDEAIRHYEVLLKLRQWAGYRPQAMLGMADCFYRLNELPGCLEWLKAIQEGFPSFYETKKLGEFQTMAQARRQRLEAAKTNALEVLSFRGFHRTFEPGDDTQPMPPGTMCMPALGIDRPNAAVIYVPLSHENIAYTRQISNLAGEGWFWAELWYCNSAAHARGILNPSFCAAIAREDNQRGSEIADPMDCAYGEWRKAGGFIRAPLTQDGQAVFNFSGLSGLYKLDGLALTPISDRDRENLRLFIEGATPQ